MEIKDKKINKIEIGNVCVQSSTESMKELSKVVDELLSKHKETITHIRPKIFFSPN